jgi:hypothetical protein
MKGGLGDELVQTRSCCALAPVGKDTVCGVVCETAIRAIALGPWVVSSRGRWSFAEFPTVQERRMLVQIVIGMWSRMTM